VVVIELVDGAADELAMPKVKGEPGWAAVDVVAGVCDADSAVANGVFGLPPNSCD
jgi:hypothetical protein